MKVSQRLLTEMFVDQFAEFLRNVYAMTQPNAPIEIGRYQILEYVSRSHDTPFPLIYVTDDQPIFIRGISLFDVPRNTAWMMIDYLSKLKEPPSEENGTNQITSNAKIYKKENIIRSAAVPGSSVAGILVMYYQMLDKIINSEQFQEM